MIKPVRRARALKAQKSRSVVKTLAAPTGGWNARDAIADMPETDAPAMVNFFPQTTDVILRYGSASQGHLGSAAVGNAMLLDGISGYATTPDTAAISVSGDIDLRCYANLDNWTTATAQFLLSKDGSYQIFVLNGFIGALIYSTAGATAAFISDAIAPVSNGFPLWVRVTVDLDNGNGLSVATFYTGSDGSTWTALGGTAMQNSLATILNNASALELGRGTYPASVTYQSPPLITCDSAQFDGTNDVLTRASLTGTADSKTGIASFWIRLDGGDATSMVLFEHDINPQIAISRNGSNVFQFVGRNQAGTLILLMTTTSSYVTSTTWLHVLASWSLATGTTNLYINDVSNKTTTTATNDTLDYTSSDVTVGGPIAGSVAALKRLNGCLAEFYVAYGQYLDFSVTANRRRFISAAGKPVNLGNDGSVPTGTAPTVYLHLDDAEAPANFAVNTGTGGNFTITGALTVGSTSPSD